MKKSAIALAVAAALAASAAAQAETTFYGRAALAVTYQDIKKVREDINSPDDIINFFNDGIWDIRNAGSRWGVRGSEDLGNGLSAIYHIETNINASEYNGNGDGQTGRLAWVGLQGGFGAVKIGAQWTPFYNALGATDIFNEANWFDKYNGPFRQNNSILYETPSSITAFKGEAMLVMNGADPASDGIDVYDIGASGNFGPVYVGAAYRSEEGQPGVLNGDPGTKDNNMWGITASFDIAGASIAALYTDYDSYGIFDLDGVEQGGNSWYVTGQYTFGNNILKAGWGQASLDGRGLGDTDEWAIGIQHNLSKRTRVWIEYQDDDGNGGFVSDDGRFVFQDESLLSIGLRHDF